MDSRDLLPQKLMAIRIHLETTESVCYISKTYNETYNQKIALSTDM